MNFNRYRIIFISASLLIVLFPYSTALVSDVDLKLDGDGFHRSVIVTVNLVSNERLVECKVLYKFYIPYGSYLDLETFRVPSTSSGGHIALDWYSPDNFDIEKNTDGNGGIRKGNEKILHICSDRSILNAFLFNETFVFPLHFYYGRAVDGDEHFPFKEINFRLPDVLVSCYKDNKVQKGDRQMVKAPCACPTSGRTTKKVVKLCDWLVANSNSQGTSAVKTRVPVGRIGHSVIAVWGTMLAVASCCLYLFYATCANSGIAKVKPE